MALAIGLYGGLLFLSVMLYSFLSFPFYEWRFPIHSSHHTIRRPALNATTAIFAINGAATGGSQPRLEIRELAQDSVMWNIYLHAIDRFQRLDQSDPLSYYQIAGMT